MARRRRIGGNALILLSKMFAWPWASASELSLATGIPLATVNRNLDGFYRRGWAESRMVGRGATVKRRWKLNSECLEEEFTVDHSHRGPYGTEDHSHNPLDPSVADHLHLPWALSEASVRALYDRLPCLVSFYDIALRLFDDAGPDLLFWIGEDRPSLVEWRFLRRGQLLEAIAVYENSNHEFHVGFYWIGLQLKPSRLLEKWAEQFDSLAYTSEAMQFELRMNPYRMNDADPDFDPSPQLSLYVVVGADEYAARQAMECIPRGGYLRDKACSWWISGDPCRKIGESGRVWPGGDVIADRFEDVRLGEPERVAPLGDNGQRDAPPFPQSMSSVLPYRIFSWAEEHAAIRVEDGEYIFRDCPEDVEPAFSALQKDGMLKKYGDEYYLTDLAMNYVAARDRISVTSVRDRLLTYVGEDDYRRNHELDHNRGMWRIVRALHRHGIKVWGGWRGVRNFPGVTQIQPDGLLYADGPWGRGLYLVEFERSATGPDRVTEKLRTFRRALRLGIRFWVIWITETHRAATRFLERTRNLDVMVATLEELEAGPIAGPGAIWRSTAEGDVELKPFESQ